MAEWYERAKARMKVCDPPITQEELMPLFGVTTRGAVGHYLNGRRVPSPAVMVALADKLGVSLDELLRGAPRKESRASQDVGWNIPMLSEALVSLDRAIRKRGLVYDAAYVAPALRLAYLERLKHPERLDRAGYAAYDREVSKQLQGQQAEHEREHRGAKAAGVGGVGKAASTGAKARRSR